MGSDGCLAIVVIGCCQMQSAVSPADEEIRCDTTVLVRGYKVMMELTHFSNSPPRQ